MSGLYLVFVFIFLYSGIVFVIVEEISADYIASELEADYRKELSSAKSAEILVQKSGKSFMGRQTPAVNVHSEKDGVITDAVTLVLVKDGRFMLITAAAEAASSDAYLELFTAIN